MVAAAAQDVMQLVRAVRVWVVREMLVERLLGIIMPMLRVVAVRGLLVGMVAVIGDFPALAVLAYNIR